MIKVTVLVDDKVCRDSRVKSTHGLSLYIEFKGKYILFDAGPSPDILQFNSETLNVDLELLDLVVVSHHHIDHYGGLPHVGWINPLLNTYIPYGSWETVGFIAKKNDLKPIEVIDWLDAGEDVRLTKPFHGPPYEHFLVLTENKRLAIFTGCFHPQPLVLKEIAEKTGAKPWFIIGGLHFSNAPQHILDSAINVFRETGVEKIAPLHCTHERLIKVLEHNGFDVVSESCCGGVFKA